MFGACQRKASCWAKKKKIVALSIKTLLLSGRLLQISGIVMKDIIQDVGFAKARLLKTRRFLSRCAHVLPRNTPIYFIIPNLENGIFE